MKKTVIYLGLSVLSMTSIHAHEVVPIQQSQVASVEEDDLFLEEEPELEELDLEEFEET